VRRRVLSLGLSLWAFATGAQDVTDLERVTVVGSRLPRVNAETALPVQIIRREDIERSGATTVEEVLARVSASFGGFPEALGLGNADTPGLSGAALRGLGTGETLVLLNGRRLANYAFTSTSGPGVDLHIIPLAAIDRIEILKDGASALYGSDAIAGVINFVTRQDFSGVALSGSYSKPEAGGAERARGAVSAGVGNIASDGFNVFAVLDAQHNDALRATDRSFTSTSYRPELGLDGTSPSSWPANITFAHQKKFLNPEAPACTAQTISKLGGCFFDPATTLNLTAPSRQITLLSRGTLQLAPETQAYAEALGATSNITFALSPAPAIGSGFGLPETSPYYPTGLGLTGTLPLAYRAVPLGRRTTEVESTNWRLLGGVKSRLAEWDIDSAATFNQTRSSEHFLSGEVDAQLLRDALSTGLVNPFGPSDAAGTALFESTQLYGVSRQAMGRTVSIDLRGSRDLMALAGGPLATAVGIEARYESLQDVQMAISARAAGGAPKDASRQAQAAYVELVAPFMRSLEVQAAARLDHYSDFGAAVSPKLAVRFQPEPTWLIRASAGKGFRAPSLPELYTRQVTGIVEFGDNSDPARCPTTGLSSDCSPIVPNVSGGNPALQPQTSTQGNVGLVIEPSKDWLASIDFWAIHLKNVISQVDLEDVIANPLLYDGRNVFRGPVDPAFPQLPGPIIGLTNMNQNLGDWRVSGVDVNLSLKATRTPIGNFSFTFEGTYVQKDQQDIFVGNEVDLIGRVAPRWKQVLSASLDQGPWSSTLSYLYRRGYVDGQMLPDGSTRSVAAYQIWDGQLAYSLGRDARIALNVANLLNTPPPFTNQQNTFQVGYDPLYADPRGRTWTLSLQAAWH
jgi:iron complex outermembrane recepter protein